MMRVVFAVALLYGLTAPAGAVAAAPRTLSLYLSAGGQLYQGRHVPISRKTLIRDLTNGTHDGLYDEVLVEAAPNATYAKVAALQQLLRRYGPIGMKMQLVTGKRGSVAP